MQFGFGIPQKKKIGKGVVVLVGIANEDKWEDCEWILRKTFNTRLLSNDEGKQWTTNVLDNNYDVLFVSQFTLLVDASRRKKPSFSRALPPQEAKGMYEKFVEKAKEEYGGKGGGLIEDGEFGAMMDVSIENDGPVTIIVDSKNKS